MKIRGTIDLKPDGTAEVSSADSGYHRELSSQEVLMLRQTAGSIDFPKLQTNLRNPKAADQYQYDITIKTSDGRSYNVTVGESPAAELERSASGLGKLVDWIRHEADAIWEKKIQ
jgi:hypothetical protein